MLKLGCLSNLLVEIFDLWLDTLRFIRLSLRPHFALAAENLFLRKQLALYLERQVKPRRAKVPTRLTLVLLSRLFAWREALTIVKPDTLIRWHQQGFRLFWRWKSKPRGRPRVPVELQKLIVKMANENPTWGEERIAAELLLKLGIRISPRTVRRYMPPDHGRQRGPSSQRWMTFVQNHAHGILACDFFVTVTAGFRVLYVFVIMEVGTRRIAHFNVTAHPTADWTLQQFREVITGVAGLVLDTAGNLYGTTTTTIVGRVYGAGVVFKLTPTGSETVLHNFTVAGGGAEPYGGLLRDKAGNLYGTTSNGGAYHYGVVFELIPCDSGYGFSVVYSFPGGADGGNPHAGLIQDAVGNLYGTTGTFYPGYNVVFKLSPSGTETVLHTFTGGADGYDPQAGLIQDPAGNLYGTTVDGGSARSGLCGQIGGCGVVFKLTP